MYWTTLEISAPRCALMCYPSSNITYCIACLLCIGVILLNQFNSKLELRARRLDPALQCSECECQSDSVRVSLSNRDLTTAVTVTVAINNASSP